MTGKELGERYLHYYKIAWSARAEPIILAAFDELERIRATVRNMGTDAMEQFDSVVVPAGFKPIVRMID